jgi:L-alanine-DL-glutamate epimerase-like enolase superfamily enzyme
LTDQGIEGVGVTGYAPSDARLQAALRQFIGANPLVVYEMTGGRITGRSEQFREVLAAHRHLDGPLFDLIGKLTNRPCYELLGGPVRERVEVYDGSLYFSDVWFRDRGVRAVVEETEESARSGYLGMKYKIGRGDRWMEKQAGAARDIEVLRAARKALGSGIKILADANNAYAKEFELAWRVIEATKEANLYWLEEMFPEDVAKYTELRSRMEKAGIRTLIADGETERNIEPFRQYLKPRRLVDVLQLDIRQGGFLDNMELARLGAEAGAITVPHNWASHVGLLMGLHLAKAVKSVPAAEDDRSTCDVLATDGYEFRGGCYTVGRAPGLGIHVDDQVYRDKYQPQETVVA